MRRLIPILLLAAASACASPSSAAPAEGEGAPAADGAAAPGASAAASSGSTEGGEPAAALLAGASPPLPARRPRPPGASDDPDFRRWLAALRREALADGRVSAATFDAVLGRSRPLRRVVELDRRQPEFALSFARYHARLSSPERVERGRRALAEHAALLAEVERARGVPAEILVSFWSLETNQGAHLGSFDAAEALATLAYDRRRSRFFRAELLELLRLVESGDIGWAPGAPARGSWAGALGHMQFLPSTWRRWAVDGDGDGRRDLFGSLPDAFHSAGAFLAGLGWRRGEPWGEEVLLPEGFDAWGEVSTRTPPRRRLPPERWTALGVRRVDGSPLPGGGPPGALLLPSGARGPAWLAYANYDRVLGWNRSLSYALAVGSLSDRLAGAPPPRASPDDGPPVRLSEVRRLQEALAAAGLYAGEIDGRWGSGSRSAAAGWQRARGLPADGHLSRSLLEAVLGE